MLLPQLAISAQLLLDVLGALLKRHALMPQQALVIIRILALFVTLLRIAILAFHLEGIAFGARILKLANLLEQIA